MTTKSVLLCDIEVYHGFFLVAFKRHSDGAVLTFEISDRKPELDRTRLRRVLMQNRIVTYNGNNFDLPLIWYAIFGATCEQLKAMCDRIFGGNMRSWQTYAAIDIEPPKIDHIDLIEPQPNAFASLKKLNGRLHGPRLQDLPYPPDARLTHVQMDEVTDYCVNDLDATGRVYQALIDPLALRETLSTRYAMDLMSKSDAQIGEAIIRSRVEKALGRRIAKPVVQAGKTFRYNIPDYLTFERDDLKLVLDKLRETDFVVRGDGKVDLPPWLSNKTVEIGQCVYAVGIGGLHSTEKNRAVYSDYQDQLIDFDVASYYPAIIIGSGLYPEVMGPAFLDVYSQIRDERIVAKGKKDFVTDQALKIALNGSFGKLGSQYSVLYAPHLLIAITLTGQLALLMLIERAETAGIPVVSANTDGVVFRCPSTLRHTLAEVTEAWQHDTGFVLEDTKYDALLSQSVNTYIAVKSDGKVKRKGSLANPRSEGDLRTQMMNDPSMNVCADAVVALVTKGTPIEQTIRECTDVRDFVTVVNCTKGATWRGEYLGKTVRYYWAEGGDPILEAQANASTGNFKKVSKTDGCRPLMEMGEDLPRDVDYQRYVDAANEILKDVGYTYRPPEMRKVRVLKARRLDWLIESIAA